MGSRLEKKSNAVRKRIESHTFSDETGEEYEGSHFGGFGDYFRRKKIKLQNLDVEIRANSTENPPIFKGVVAHVNGYTQPSLNDLHKLIVSHGGGFMQYLDGKTMVTHIIASNLTPKKAVEFKRYRIVKPAWIVDSVNAGKLLPWNQYRVVDEGVGQKVLAFENGKVVNQENKQLRTYKEQTDASWYTKQIKGELTPSNSQQTASSNEWHFSSDDDIVADFPTSYPLFSEEDEGEEADGSQVNDDVVEPGVTTVEDESTHTRDEPRPTLNQPATKPARSSQSITRSPNEGELDEPGIELAETKDQDYATPSSQGQKRQRSPVISPTKKRAKLTAEEHNAILLADPKIRKSTVVNPDFLESYYRESRLHHLSAWKADLKAQLQALAAEKSASQKERQKRPPGSRGYIMHVDFDSFFAAVSLKKHPHYIDKPAVVAHGTGSGSEIASCNYPARKFGIKNGMWMKRALELCPELKILPYDFPAYEEASKAFYDAILDIGAVVQSVSIDEALLDTSALCAADGGTNGKTESEERIYREQEKANEISQSLRDDIKRRTGCNVSVGIGANVLLAKLALRKAKPAGQYQIKPEEVLGFIGDLEARDLPGVAGSIGGKLEDIGVKYIKDIRELSKEKLMVTLGPKTGEKIWDYARGIDRTEVGNQVIRKSVSAEVNWGVRFENQDQADEFIYSLSGELSKRLLRERVKGRQITMKIMRRAADAPLDPYKHLGHGKCDVFNKSLILGVSTNSKDVLAREALSVLKGFKFPPGELRGIGIQMTKLEPIKPGPKGPADSSQRRLQFKVSDKPKASSARAPEDPIQDEVETPKKQRTLPPQTIFGSTQLNTFSPTRKPLNTLGTQFVIPSQVDPKVLAELPEDIRNKFAQHVQRSPEKPGNIRIPASPFAATIPNQSQLDPGALAALPDDLRAEVLAQYGRPLSPGNKQDGTDYIIPQVPPRKDRAAAVPKRPPAPTFPRKRGRPPKAAITATTAVNNTTLTQSNFVAAQNNSVTPQDDESDLDTEFLAALPEDIRVEVIAEHRRARLAKRSALAVPAVPGAAARKSKAIAHASAAAAALAPRVLLLPPRPARPTFTTERLWREDDLREAITDWIREFRDDGPFRDDVTALKTYLVRVIEDERNMEKARSVVSWLKWQVEEEMEDVIIQEVTASPSSEERLSEAKKGWENAVKMVAEGVQEAMKTRGLGTLMV